MILKLITYAFVGLIFILGIFLLAYKPQDKKAKIIKQRRILNSNLSLQDKFDIINGKNSSSNNKIRNYFFEIKLILAKMNKIDDYGKIKLISIIFALTGLVLSIVIKNYLFAIIFIPVFFLAPYQFVKMRYKKFNKILEEELETGISLITISYARTSNLVTAVSECLNSLPPNVKPYFEDFIFEVTSVNANIKTALLNLKTKVENKTFQQWVERLIICQNDRSAISSLQTFVNEFADNRAIQNELDSEIYNAKIEMYMMVGFVFVAPALLFVVQREAFWHLMNDTAGKITEFICALLVIFVLFIGNKVAKPIKFRGNKD